MTASDLIGTTTISAVWVALGGDRPKHGRACAFYRTGADNPNAVSLDDTKGCWHDFRDGVGGGVLDLIQHVLGGTRSDALQWLADFIGVPLDDDNRSPAAKRELTRQREAARAKALDIGSWRRAYVIELNRQKAARGDEYSASLCNTLENGPPGSIVAEYEWHLANDPKHTAALIAEDRRLERDAKTIAAEMVLLLAAAGKEIQ